MKRVSKINQKNKNNFLIIIWIFTYLWNKITMRNYKIKFYKTLKKYQIT